MWAIVINPVSGGGKGARLGKEVAGHFASKKLNYQVISSTTAARLRSNLEDFLQVNSQNCDGVIAVGGDGLAHLVIRL
jgi:diacylglycerol kinase (ATP)